MNFPYRPKKQFVYCGNTTKSMMAEVVKTADGQVSLVNVVTEVGPLTDPDVLKRLISRVPPPPASEVSISFPLHMFEVLNLTLPLLPTKAVARTLPYHIAKAIDTPLSQYIYDWQVNKKQKDQMQISVYLFPVILYDEIQSEFSNNHMEVKFFEADVFTAFAHLDFTKAIKADEATLCLLIWPESLTLGVCESGKIKLARSVDLIKPAGEDNTETDESLLVGDSSLADDAQDTLTTLALDSDLAMDTTGIALQNSDATNLDNDESSLSVLSAFDLICRVPGDDDPDALILEYDQTDSTPDRQNSDESIPNQNSLKLDYLRAISIEIMRTRDFYSAVMKGAQIQSYFILGAGSSFDQLNNQIKEAIGEDAQEITARPTRSCGPELHVVGLGAATRW